MRVRFFLLLLCTISCSFLNAQSVSLKGMVVDKEGNPLPFATAALLHPADSTLAFFGITNAEGYFDIRNIKPGEYLAQISYIGCKTFYKLYHLPLASGENIGAIVLLPLTKELGAVEITAEKVPVIIKKDTIEYNAGAFKTKPDAVTEDLLKKLPGVEVDRAGNVKAQGEDVRKVLVDGKEFFGNDPKVATRNIPADAIKKVQVYDKKSDEAEMTGIDDGKRDKTINLLLKDDKKNGWFGDVQAGGGTDEHFQTGGKLYRFDKKIQFAALGMLNNINRFGFTMQDYFQFNGGLQNMMNGDGSMQIRLGEDNSFPVNFGQPVTGLTTSGAGGVNYTYERAKGKRINLSYLGNGADKKLVEDTYMRNFTGAGSFVQKDNTFQTTLGRNHRLNLNIQEKIDSTQRFILGGQAELLSNSSTNRSIVQSFSGELPVNFLRNTSDNNALRTNAAAQVSYIKTWNHNWKMIKVSGDFSWNKNVTDALWNNTSEFFPANFNNSTNQFQRSNSNDNKFSAKMAATRSAGKGYYLQPELEAGAMSEILDRSQGITIPFESSIDSLSPVFSLTDRWFRPGLHLKKSSDKKTIDLLIAVEYNELFNEWKTHSSWRNEYWYFIPSLSWKNEYATGRRLGLNYSSAVYAPENRQLLPVIDNTNPLQLVTGNRFLNPEYRHDVHINWLYFDQFSFTSFFVNFSGAYTRDKINWTRTVAADLSQRLSYVNVPDDYRLTMNAEFSTPIRKLGVNIHVDGSEGWNRGINFVNGIQNQNDNLIHSWTLSFDNRKKDKWDISIGAATRIVNALFSLNKSQNNNYYNYAYFAEVSYTPNERWSMAATLDVTRYTSQGFNNAVEIPLLKAEVSRYLFKNKRGVLMLEAFDILNKNTGIERASELNFLLERQSNIIRRYVMLTFKFRINKFDTAQGGKMDIKINNR